MPHDKPFDEIILHVGHSKTGTSALQHSFLRSAKALARQGLFYPSDRNNNHDLPHLFLKAAGPGASLRAWERRFVRSARRAECRQALVSSEVFSRLSLEEKRRVLAFFGAMATRVRVLLYVRHPLGFAVSSRQQVVKTGQATYEEVCRPRRVRSISRLVRSWEEAAGTDLSWRIYDRRSLVGGDIIDDVLDAIGRPELGEILVRMQRNESISLPAALLLSRRTELQRAGRTGLIDPRRLREIAGPPFALPGASMDHLARETAVDLERLERRLGTSFLPPQFPKLPEEVFTEAACASVVELLGAVAERKRRPVIVRTVLHWYRAARTFGQSGGSTR